MIKIMLLGLLQQRDLTGYEILQYLKLSHAESWAGIKIGSIYYALNKMEEENIIKIQSIESVGNRSRTIYSITEKGEHFFERKLEDTLSQVDLNFPNSLYTAVTFLGELPYEKAIKAIDIHIKSLEKELVIWKKAEKAKEEIQSKKLPNYMKALLKNGCTHIEVNIDFLKEIKELLSKESFEVHLPDINKIGNGEINDGS
ncbi:PadR family transcriptional regulator [Alkaliphilus peptidifermentans]|uniref:Transcriptional regulator, PadR family n=1 Tax=Alkaliphilus peptidifermentans DSM 18978 TaxID=1120976 RepID=A0A1G5L4Y2_9FIRM|nr:PadR family transcriptional regulator [Alkaliphilus peptidifermentans]SCZ07624.1 transcriptional regulator, PadR family [Alkaliphilus peptidifermentans DSM 18978]